VTRGSSSVSSILMTPTKYRTVAMKRVIFLLSLLIVPALSSADDGCRDCCCAGCGCHAHCQKICRVVCEMKDVKVVCYCCKQTDVCLPCHSEICGEVCEPNTCCLARPADCGCPQCQSDHGGCLDCLRGHDCVTHRKIWQPGCSCDIRSVNKLMKYEVTKKVPTYKWVVEYRCDDCCRQLPPAPPTAVPPGPSARQTTDNGGTRALQASNNVPDAPSLGDRPVTGLDSARVGSKLRMPWDGLFK